MSKTTSITAILVGGRETRHLRVPKQTLPFGDTTVLGRTLRAYLEVGVDDIILVLGYKGESVRSSLGTLPPKVRIVKNPLFDEGMVTFLRTGVRELNASATGFCVGLGDQPLLTPALVEEFLKAFVDSKKRILVPAHQGNLGLPIFLAADLAGEVQDLPAGGELWDILKRHREEVFDYPTGYSAVVRSISDLDDYHTMLRMAGLDIPDLPEAIHAEPAEEIETDDEADTVGLEPQADRGGASPDVQAQARPVRTAEPQPSADLETRSAPDVPMQTQPPSEEP